MKLIEGFKKFLKKNISIFRVSTPVNLEFDYFVLKSENFKNKIDKIPNILWVYWDDENITSCTVQLCLKRLSDLNENYTINLLHANNICDYILNIIHFPDNLPLANKSDWIRLKILELYGGIYIDASVLICEDLDWLIDLNLDNKTESIVYYTEENSVDKSYPILENWLIGAVEGSTFIKEWRKEYEYCLLSEDHKNYYKLNAKELLKKIPLDPDYYKCYFSAQMVLRKIDSIGLTVIKSDRDAYVYSLSTTDKWSNIALADILMLNKKPQALPKMIKIINGSRKTIDEYIKEEHYSLNSIIGSIL